jgi:S1-C subfamily serine protease
LAVNSLPDAAQDLTNAAAAGDKNAAWQAAGRLASWLSDLRNPVDATAVYRVVWSGAAEYRWFDIAEVVSAAAAVRADAKPALRRLHAQMLMERGFTEEALSRLHRLLTEGKLSDRDRSQAIGHLGRIYKERFIAAVAAGDTTAARAFLDRGIETYLEGYRADPNSTWHAINAVALLARPEAQATRKDAAETARQIAAEIIQKVPLQNRNLYSAVTMAEAYLALADFDNAVEAIRESVAPGFSVFALGAFRRQLTQIWELDRKPSPGPEVVAMVSSALLEVEDGSLVLSSEEVQRARRASRITNEAVFGGDRFDSLDNYRRGLDRCSCVARIGRSVETGVGTGFIIRGNALCSKLPDSFLLVTNAHVVSEDERLRAAGALHPSEAVVTFAALEGVSPDKEFGLGKVLLSSPPDQLDVTVVELSEPVIRNDSYPLAQVLPARGSDSQVRVIGHPSGRGLSISVNKLLDHQAPKVHYRTATEGGSSGSPVFNQDWRLIGLHHAGGDAVPRLNGVDGTYEANEGIWIHSICKAIDQALP